MIVYNTKTQSDYDALMIELEEKGYKWLSGYKPTFKNYWRVDKENTCIKISDKYITFESIEWHKKKYPDTQIIEYKAKGENMTQKQIKQEVKEILHDISVAVCWGLIDTSTVEADLQEAKSSAKKLIEKIDEYLESLKPKFNVGDYITKYVEDRKLITKIDELKENKSEAHGLWYDKTKVNVKQDYWFLTIGNEAKHATPEEIAEYESALSFHNHGRVPFEVKEGDIIRDDEGNILKDDEVKILSTFPKNLKKYRFTSGRYTFLKTAEEVNEWLENK